MSDAGRVNRYFIGWDVGGWNCDKNKASRDALVILDEKRNLVGQAWRGNLRKSINKAETARDWLQILFSYCQADWPDDGQAVLAIDTPLGFSDAFVRLITQRQQAGEIGRSESNPYLFRATEHYLFEHGLKPLSPIKDMIGSQATKGMHVLAKFAPKITGCGVWSDGEVLTAIEAYLSACKNSGFIQNLLARYADTESKDSVVRRQHDSIDHQDKWDALTCALLAHAFAFHPDALASPPDFIPLNEGWIWVPKDILKPVSVRTY